MAPFDAYPSEPAAGPLNHGDTLTAFQVGSALYGAVLAAQEQAIADEATPAHSIFRTHPASLLAHLADRLGLPLDLDQLRDGLEALSNKPRQRRGGQDVGRLLQMRRQAVASVWRMRVRRALGADAADQILISDYRARGVGSARRLAEADVATTVRLVSRGFQRELWWLRTDPDAAEHVAVESLSRLAETHDFARRPHIYPKLIVSLGRQLLSLHRPESTVRREAVGECGCLAHARRNGATVTSLDDQDHAQALAGEIGQHLPSPEDQVLSAVTQQESLETLLADILRDGVWVAAQGARGACAALRELIAEHRVAGSLSDRAARMAQQIESLIDARCNARRATSARPASTMSPAWRDVVLPPDASFSGWLAAYHSPEQAVLPLGV